MTVLIHPVEISDAIAGFVVTGLTIKKLSELPDAVSRGLPVMIPAPDFITGFNLEDNSSGGGGASQQTAEYTLNYRILFGEVGTKRGLASHYQGMVAEWAKITDLIRVNDSTAHAVHLQAQAPAGFGQVPGPDDKKFFGFDMGIRVTELIN